MKYKPSHLIKEYDYWSLQASEDQSYLGRCVIWCKREDASDLERATKGEQQELFAILTELKKALNKTFRPDHMNYTFLGNKTPHLHCHVIPRYKNTRELAGRTFVDRKWGKNPYKGEYRGLFDEVLTQRVAETLKKTI